MKLEDFTEKEQNEIKAGLSTAEITDKETTDKILALVPQDWIKKIPFFVRKHATTKTIERMHGAPTNGQVCGAKRPRCGASGHPCL